MVRCCCSKEVRVRIVLWYAAISSVLGFSAALVFGIKYQLYTVAMWATIGSLYALAVSLLHCLAVRNQFRPNPDSVVTQIIPAILLIAVCGMIFAMGVTVYAVAKAIATEEKLDVSSHYILGVWGFVCLKWSFYLFQLARRYATTLDTNAEDAAPFVVQEVLPHQEEV